MKYDVGDIKPMTIKVWYWTDDGEHESCAVYRGTPEGFPYWIAGLVMGAGYIHKVEVE